MLSLKKSFWGFIFLGVSQINFAQIIGCQTNSVSGACPEHLWHFGAYALYLEASRAGFEFEQNIGLSPNLPWGWGFAFDASYAYASGDDITINWQHLRSQVSSELDTPLTYRNWTSITTPDLYTSVSIDAANTIVNPAWDQINVEMGKTIQLGLAEQIRFHGGVNFSHLSYNGQQLSTGQYQELVQSVTNYNQWLNLTSSYNGYGIRTGIMLTHDFQNHLSLFANAATSLLAGSEKTSQFIFNNGHTRTTGSNQMRIVPELDGRIGSKYAYHLPEGILSAEISWLWLDYFNPLSHEARNFGLQGLYFGLQFSGDMA